MALFTSVIIIIIVKLAGLILFDFDRISVKLSVRQLWEPPGRAQTARRWPSLGPGQGRVLIVKAEVQPASRVRGIKRR